MAVPNSGTIGLITHVVAEFGDDGSISLRDYLRGGSLVPDTAPNSGVPTSGTISLRDLLGAEGSGGTDVTPDAVNWANIGPTSSPGSNANQTITGIDTTITLEVFNNSTGLNYYSKNGGAFTFIGNGGSLTVVNNDTLRFQVVSSIGTVNGTVTVRNASDGDVSLDTFTYNVTS